MFLVFNKEKIYAFLVSILTVFLLFFIASTNTQKDVETSTKADTSYNVVDNSAETKETSAENKENDLVPNDDSNSIDTSGNIVSNDTLTDVNN